jgi:hypothetical protein
MKRILCSVAALIAAVWAAPLRAEEAGSPAVDQLNTQMKALEQRVTELEQLVLPLRKNLEADARRTGLRRQFDERMGQDVRVFSKEQLQEIENLYQVSNRNWNSPEARTNLVQLVTRYANANRTGCALLYLGQWSQGQEREDYLKEAIEKHSDSWYGDGVQVGAMARYWLAVHYRQLGRNEEAEQLFQQIRTEYPNAINHQGVPLADVMSKGKEAVPQAGGEE